jgi:hypothetical protein
MEIECGKMIFDWSWYNLILIFYFNKSKRVRRAHKKFDRMLKKSIIFINEPLEISILKN